MKHIGIVTVDYNSEKETHDFLASVKKLNTTGLQLSIVVVDNASKEAFTLTSEEKKLPITLIRNQQNLGFSGGYNSGMQKALEKNVDYVMAINNDTILDRQLLQELVKAMESEENIGIVVPKIYFAKGSEYHKDRYTKDELGKVFWYAGGDIDWANVMSYHRGVDEVDHGQYDTTEHVGFATGCCMFFKSDVLRTSGMFDDNYFLYCEDADLNMRMKNAGYSIVYAPKAVIWHVNAASSGVGSKLHDYFITRNRMLFGMKYAPLRSKIALIRESIRLLFTGREWQKIAIRDFYLGRFGRGSFH